MTLDTRTKLRSILRDKLNGKDNLENRNALRQELNISDSTIKGWISPGGTNVPPADSIPIICKVLNITYYELFDDIDPNTSIQAKTLLDAYNRCENKNAINILLNIKND